MLSKLLQQIKMLNNKKEHIVYESNQIGSIRQYDNMQVVQGTNINQYQQDDQAAYQYIDNQDMNANINSPMSRGGNAYAGLQEEERIDYNEFVNQVGNEAYLKALGLTNWGLNTTSSSTVYNNIDNIGGINLNTLSSTTRWAWFKCFEFRNTTRS